MALRHSVDTIVQEMEGIFGPTGSLAAQFEAYEHRPQQWIMASQVLNCFFNGGITLIEAGTGTGKSLAYLIPALLWARENNEKVIISTHTINLQEQLLTKDIPLARKALGWDFRASLVKGWSNYLCLQKLKHAQQEEEQELLHPEGIGTLTAIVQWASTTVDGTRADMGFLPSEEIWEMVCAESDLCTRSRCPYFQQCFYFKARREMQDATVLVCNHHLVFADMAVRRVMGFDTDKAVLPRYYHIIFDEAHHIEDVATDYLGVQITQIGVTRLLNRIYSVRRSAAAGLAGRILRSLGGAANGRDEELARYLQWDIPAIIRRISDETQHLFGLLRRFCAGGSLAQEDEYLIVGPDSALDTLYSVDVYDSYTRWQEAMASLVAVMDKVVEELEGKDADDGEGLLTEAKALRNRVKDMQEALKFLYNADTDNYVFWLELGGKNKSLVKFCAAPIVIAEELQSSLLQHLVSVVCTSATLTVAGQFDYLIDSLGLRSRDNGIAVPEPLNGVVIDSPFDYEKQALVCVPSDLPDPNAPEAAMELVAYLLDVLPITKGRAFVLFTSYSMLEQVYHELIRLLPGLGINLVKQGDAPRGVLLKEFLSNDPAVLLGTDSFWEGVDVPGEALSCVVIARLPFRVPSEPVTSARIAEIERQGRNSFREYMLPQAVIKFKQGFGRLIRSKTDRGVVIICDPRAISKSYGQQFLRSLPKCSVLAAKRSRTLEAIQQWFDRTPSGV